MFPGANCCENTLRGKQSIYLAEQAFTESDPKHSSSTLKKHFLQMKLEKLDVFPMIANLCQEWSKVSTSSLWEKPDDQTNSEHIDARAFGVMYTWGGSSLVDRDWHSWLELMHTETKRKFVPRSVASF